MVLNKPGKFSKAEDLLAELLPEIQGNFHGSDPRALGCRTHLMEALTGQGKLEQLHGKGTELAKSYGEPHREAEVELMDECGRCLMRGFRIISTKKSLLLFITTLL